MNNVNIKCILSQDFFYFFPFIISYLIVCAYVEDQNPVRSVAQKVRKKEQEREQEKEVSQEKQRRARGEGYSE